MHLGAVRKELVLLAVLYLDAVQYSAPHELNSMIKLVL